MKLGTVTALILGAAASAPLAGPAIAQPDKIIEMAGTIEPTISEVTRAQYKWIENAIAQFEKEFPDFEVRYQVYNGASIDATIIRDFQVGVKHDVVMVESGHATGHQKAGSLLDLSKYYEKWPAEDRADLDWLEGLDYFKDEGAFLVVPAVMHARAIAYRKDLFAEAGIDPIANPPATLDQLVEYAKKLTKGDVYGLGMYLGNHRATAELYFAPYVWMQGEDLIDPNTKMATFAGPAGVKTAQWLSDIVNKDKVTPEYVVSGDYVDAVTTGLFSGKFAMVEGFGNYFFANLAESPMADKTGFFVPPLKTRFLNYWALGISANTDYPDESARLLQLLMEPENLILFDYGLPVRQSAYETERYGTDAYKIMKESASGGRTFPKTVNYGPLTDAIAAAVQEIVVTKGDPAEILKKYEDEYNASYGGE